MVIVDKINRITALIESKANEEDLDSLSIGRKVAEEINDSLLNLSLIFKAVTGVSLYSYMGIGFSQPTTRNSIVS